ncbi:MAG TPA: hypothetical protein VJ226_06565 [Bradyrhizobium sp.]|nr:hypothetical protein [Bradyrhizobium sp.]
MPAALRDAFFDVFFDASLGTTLRAIGRGFGNGTFDLAAGLVDDAGAASAANANPTASARLIASTNGRAGDRTGVAGAEGITAFLRGESFNR